MTPTLPGRGLTLFVRRNRVILPFGSPLLGWQGWLTGFLHSLEWKMGSWGTHVLSPSGGPLSLPRERTLALARRGTVAVPGTVLHALGTTVSSTMAGV